MSRYLLDAAPQHSPEWYAARAGKATGSKAHVILMQGKGKAAESETRRKYIFQLVAERLTGQSQEEGYISKDMQWGIDQEPYARMAYEEANSGEFIEVPGFAHLPDIAAGCSVDGFVGEGFIEVKCPKTTTHLIYRADARVPPDYVPQVTHNLWITGAPWVDFVSFDPRVPRHLQLFVVRMFRNEVNIDAHEEAVRRFLDEVDATEKRHAEPLKVAA